MKQNKYLLGQEVWIMNSNKPDKQIIHAIRLVGAAKLNFQYQFESGFERMESDVFLTKEDIKNSLFN